MWHAPTPVQLSLERVDAFLAVSANRVMMDRGRAGTGWSQRDYALRHLRISAAQEKIRAMTGVVKL